MLDILCERSVCTDNSCKMSSIIYPENKNGTVKTLYNVTRSNRIFNIRHKIAGNGSVSIEIPSL